MIYFVQKHNNDVSFGSTDDLQQTLFLLKSRFEDVELLGVMPGNELEAAQLRQRFAIYKVEGENEWFSSPPELIDFIDENATVDQQIVRPSARYKASDYTPIKQQALHDALTQQMNLIVHITEKWNKARPYTFFDLNAGPGMTEDQQPGSPLIFRRIASEYMAQWPNFHFEATLYEADLQTYSKLVRVLGNDPRFIIKNENHDELRSELLKKRDHPTKQDKWTFGAVYADPSNATLPWELLELFNHVYPRVDIMINIACASYKRTIAQAGYQTLADRLPTIKKHWIVRKPFGKHQWSILVGTNWEDYPAWRRKNFYPWNDQGVGTSIFEKLVYTPEQLQSKYNLPLFPTDDED
jgi:hypothetical protein